MYFAEIVVLPAILFPPKIKVASRKTAIYSTVRAHSRKFRWQSNGFCIKLVSIESLEPDVAVISQICGHILNRFASWVQPYFGVHTLLEELRNIYQSHAFDLLRNCLSGQDGGCKQRGQTAMMWLKRIVYAQISDL